MISFPSLSIMTAYHFVSALAIMVGLVVQANASSMTQKKWAFLHSQNQGHIEHQISVYPGAAGYSGHDDESNPTSGVFGDGTVEAYHFFKANDGGNKLVTLAESGGLITGQTTTKSFKRVDSMKLWENTDPKGFSTMPDYRVGGTGAIQLRDWFGTIDISGLKSGTIYIMYGHYRGMAPANFIDLTMKDADGKAADVQLKDVGSTDRPNNWEQYVVEIEFVNDSGHDLIEYKVNFTDNGRLGGIVIDGQRGDGENLELGNPVVVDHSVVSGGARYATWISAFGGVGNKTGFNEDPDRDNLVNGLENYLGTNPSQPNDGLHGMELSGDTFSFRHPLNGNPASDIVARYKWSMDSDKFYNDGDVVRGTTIRFSQKPLAEGEVVVTGRINGKIPENIYVLIEVEHQP